MTIEDLYKYKDELNTLVSKCSTPGEVCDVIGIENVFSNEGFAPDEVLEIFIRFIEKKESQSFIVA